MLCIVRLCLFATWFCVRLSIALCRAVPLCCVASFNCECVASCCVCVYVLLGGVLRGDLKLCFVFVSQQVCGRFEAPSHRKCLITLLPYLRLTITL